MIEKRWMFFWVFLVAFFVMGYYAWDHYLIELSVPHHWTDSLYYTMQTLIANSSFEAFTVSVQEVAGKVAQIPFLLNFLRLFGPLLLVFGFFSFLADISRAVFVRLKYIKIALTHFGHIVFIGVDTENTFLIQTFTEKDRRVLFRKRIVVVSEEPKLSPEVKKSGVTELTLPFGNFDFLSSLQLHRASHIIVSAGDDFLNLSIAKEITEKHMRNRRSPEKESRVKVRNGKTILKTEPEVLVKLSKAENIRWFKELHGADKKRKVRYRVLDLKQICASYFVDRIAEKLIDQNLRVAGPLRKEDEKELTILLSGIEEMGEETLLEVIQMYHFVGVNRINLLLLEDHASHKIAELRLKHPGLFLIDDFRLIPTDLAHFYREDFPEEIAALLNNTAICITTFRSMLANLERCHQLRNYFFRNRREMGYPPIVFFSEEKIDTVAKLMKESRFDKDVDFAEEISFGIENVMSFLGVTAYDFYGILREVIDIRKGLQSLFDLEEVAESVHNEYFEVPNDEAGRMKLQLSWQLLNEYFKEENRYTARHLAYKLRQINMQFCDPEKREESEENEVIDEAERLFDLNKKSFSEKEQKRWNARKYLWQYRYMEDYNTLFRKELSAKIAIDGGTTADSTKKKLRLYRDILKVHDSLKQRDDLTESQVRDNAVFFTEIRKILDYAGKGIRKIP